MKPAQLNSLIPMNIKHTYHALRAFMIGATLTLGGVAVHANPTELLTNGGFEAGLPGAPDVKTPTGWVTAADGTYAVLATSISPAPTGTFASPTYVGEGEYAMRRAVYNGQKGGTEITIQSVIYQLSALPEFVEEGMTLNLSALVRPQITASANAQAFAAIEFYSNAAGTALIGTRQETDRVDGVSNVTIPYTSVTASIVVPAGAVSFKILGVTTFGSDVGGTYYSGFDSFSLTIAPIPEPQSAGLLAGVAMFACLFVGRRVRL